MSDDAVSLIQDRLRSVAAAYGYPHARISLFPTLIIVALREGEPATIRTIDSVRQLRLDQASEVIAVAAPHRARRARTRGGAGQAARDPGLAPAVRTDRVHRVARRADDRPRPGHPPGGGGAVGLRGARDPRRRDEGLGAAARGHRLSARRRRGRGGLGDRVPQPGRRRRRLAAADDPAARHLPAGRAADHGDRRPRDGGDDHGRQPLRRRAPAARAPRDRHRRRRRADRRPQLRAGRGQRHRDARLVGAVGRRRDLRRRGLRPQLRPEGIAGLAARGALRGLDRAARRRAHPRPDAERLRRRRRHGARSPTSSPARRTRPRPM